MNEAEELVVPSGIDWRHLKSFELEECVYWLLAAMKPTELNWRVGGVGGGAPDGGRDLETTFHLPTPDGETTVQRWWVECKGRTSTVSKSEVTEAVNNASGRVDVDVVVLATNSQFSNPTRDWVREWQISRPRPIVRLWDGKHLERLTSQHPEVVCRLFSQALTPTGLLAAARSRFWRLSDLTDVPDLERIWSGRAKLAMSPQSLIALTASEFANGNPAFRPWSALVNEQTVEDALALLCCKVMPLVFRASSCGVHQSVIVQTGSHLLVTALARLPVKQVVAAFCTGWRRFGVADESALATNWWTGTAPVFYHASHELLAHCAMRCDRMMLGSEECRQSSLHNYFWHRLVLDNQAQVEHERRAGRMIVVEAFRKACSAGLQLNEQVRCPLNITGDFEPDAVPKILAEWQKVVRYRAAAVAANPE